MTKPAGPIGGLRGELRDDSAERQSTRSTVDYVLTNHARRVRLDRHRRALDRYLVPLDPWDLAEPLDWHATHMDRGVPERECLGRELAEAGWCA